MCQKLESLPPWTLAVSVGGNFSGISAEISGTTCCDHYTVIIIIIQILIIKFVDIIMYKLVDILNVDALALCCMGTLLHWTSSTQAVLWHVGAFWCDFMLQCSFGFTEKFNSCSVVQASGRDIAAKSTTCPYCRGKGRIVRWTKQYVPKVRFSETVQFRED